MKLRFMSSKEEVKDVRSFIFETSPAITWQPGQYLHYVLPHPEADDRGIERWFTISSAPFEQHIMLTTRFDNDPLSSFKKALASLKPGDELEADGPKGSFTLRPGDFKHVFIAGGIGVTPFRSMLVQMAYDKQPINVDLLYANRGNEFVFDNELSSLQNQGLTIKKFVDTRISQADLEPYAKADSCVFYLSGPRAMVEAYEQLLANLQVSADNIMTDYFPGY